MVVFISLQIIFTRVLVIRTPIFIISVGFIPVFMAAYLYGPWIGSGVAIISDPLGFIMFPSGIFHPGFTITYALIAIFFGYFINSKKIKNLRVRLIIAIISVNIFSLFLNTYWLTFIIVNNYLLVLLTRLVPFGITLYIQLGISQKIFLRKDYIYFHKRP